MSDSAAVHKSGVGCLTILGLIFVALKLAEVGKVATWSWWWVLAPFWIQFAIFVVIMGGLLAFAFLAAWLDKR